MVNCSEVYRLVASNSVIKSSSMWSVYVRTNRMNFITLRTEAETRRIAQALGFYLGRRLSGSQGGAERSISSPLLLFVSSNSGAEITCVFTLDRV